MPNMEIQLAHDVPGIGLMGERVTLALQPQDVHDPTELPTYLAGYKPFGFRADEASPPVLVDNDEDKYRQFSSDDAFRRVPVKGSLNGAVPEVDPKSSLSSYKVVDRYVGSFVGRATQAQATNPGYDPLMAATRRCRNAIDLDREIDVWALLGDPNSWDASVRVAITGGSEWDAATPGDPIKDLQLAIEKAGQQVTDIWMNQKVAHAMLRNVNVRNQMRQMLGDGAAPATAAKIFMAGRQNVDFEIPGLPPIHVVASKAKTESSGAIDYVLSVDNAILMHVPPGIPTDGQDIASTWTFRRRGPSGVGYEVRQYVVEGRGPLGGTMIVTSMADVAVMTAPIAGAIVSNCLA